MNSLYDLPTSLNIRGVEQPINYDWHTALDILIYMGNAEHSHIDKLVHMLMTLYPNWLQFRSEDIPEAIERAYAYLDCGQRPDGKVRPKLIDWEQDAQLIIGAINKEANKDIRTEPQLHWWTIYNWFIGSSGGAWSNVLHLRSKLAKNQPLNKAEKQYYRDNAAIIDLKNKDTEIVRREKEEILKMLGGG